MIKFQLRMTVIYFLLFTALYKFRLFMDMNKILKKTKIILKDNEKFIFYILFFFSLVIPLFSSLKSILSRSIPFWYDPARDLLLALDNLKKPTLLGPPTGIPGVFYGPYWIWLLSIPLVFTRDPRLVTFFTLFLLYFIVFPYLLFKLAKTIGREVVLIIWLLFIISYNNYTNFLWNPHLAPLILLLLIYLILKSKGQANGRSNYFNSLFLGITAGLLANFHISLGIGIVVATTVFLFGETFVLLRTKKKERKHLIQKGVGVTIFFFVGIFLTFLPFIFFEIRHGFIQSKAIWKTLIDSFFYNSAVVGQTGLKKWEILKSLYELPGEILHLPNYIFYSILLLIFGYSYSQIEQKKFSLQQWEKRLFIYLMLCLISSLYIYLTSKNPVWKYHFIGLDLIAIFIIGIIGRRFYFLKMLLFIWLFILLSINFKSIFNHKTDPLSVPSLYTKKYIVEKIYEDARNTSFVVYVYSPSIYTYDYDYIFQWLGEEKYHYVPNREGTNSKYVYLVIPKTTSAVIEDFIHYRTPDMQYESMDQWQIADGTLIIKRVLR